MEILKHIDPFDVITKDQIVHNTKNLLINGNSNLSYQIIKEAVKSSEINQVTLISSKKIDFLNPKFKQIQHENFFDLKLIEEEFKSKDLCFYVEDELEKKNSIEKFKNFVNVLNDNNDEDLSFNFLSQNETKLRNFLLDENEIEKFDFFEAENFLKNLKFKNLNIFKPNFIYKMDEETNIPIFQNKNLSYFYKFLFFEEFRKYFCINSKDLSKTMLEFGLSSLVRKRILKTKEINDFNKLSLKEDEI